jgi:hypothetical protein
MNEEIDLPRTFQLTYKGPELGKNITFNMYREPNLLSWNGYYKGERIRIWSSGDMWIVAGYLKGTQACYFRTGSTEVNLTIINKLVQCTCYYFDSMTSSEQSTT